MTQWEPSRALRPYTCYAELPYCGIALSDIDLNDVPPRECHRIPRVLPGQMVNQINEYSLWPPNSVCFIRYDWQN